MVVCFIGKSPCWILCVPHCPAAFGSVKAGIAVEPAAEEVMIHRRHRRRKHGPLNLHSISPDFPAAPGT
jgi:hypothetical protein